MFIDFRGHIKVFVCVVLTTLPLLFFQNCDGDNFASIDRNQFVAESLDYSFVPTMQDVQVYPGQKAVFEIRVPKVQPNDINFKFYTQSSSAIEGEYFEPTVETRVLRAGEIFVKLEVQTTNDPQVIYEGRRFNVVVEFERSDIPLVKAGAEFFAANSFFVGKPEQSSNSGLIASGQYHNCVVRGGALFCWGRNNERQLGITSTRNAVAVPTRVVNMASNVQSVSAGRRHTCAVRGRSLFCWGQNESGQLGQSHRDDFATPTIVPGLEGGVSAVSTGAYHTCVIRFGSLYCFGNNDSGQIGHSGAQRQLGAYQVPGFDKNVQAVAAGAHHTCAIKENALYCWGRNAEGQLGLGNFRNNRTRVPANTTLEPVAQLSERVQSVSANGDSTCAVVDEEAVIKGILLCFGENSSGQLGIGTLTNINTPTRPILMTENVSHVSTNTLHSCAVKNRTVSCWGNGNMGALGDGEFSSKSVPSSVVTLPEPILWVTTGGHDSRTENHTCAYSETGRVFCWGFNGDSQIGSTATGTNFNEAEEIEFN